MGNRRFAQISTSDDEEEDMAPAIRKRKLKPIPEYSEEEEDDEAEEHASKKQKNKNKKKEEEAETTSDSEDKEDDELEVKPVGDSVRVSGKGRSSRTHYEAFEYDGNQYELEDPVLLTPASKREKPYVAIIKDITLLKDGNMMVLGQWFYRPEEAEKKGGGNWESQDTRELFYSFHRDECPAESVMHKCVVHFVPLHKQLPKRKEHPGFIVQKVYDTDGKKLWKLTDRDYEEDKQHEIDLLVEKTMRRLVDLPDKETEDPVAKQDDPFKTKRNLIKKNLPPIDVSSREEEETIRSGKNKAETPGSCMTNASEYYRVLVDFNALTGDSHRDKWLEKLLREVQSCNSVDGMNRDDKKKSGSEDIVHKPLDVVNARFDKNVNGSKPFLWPDAVRAVTSLEKATHDSLYSETNKYNQKLRSLSYNLSKQAVLARRLLNGELEPSVILNMSPDELKEGLTAEERTMKEPDEMERMQMTDARCSRCSEFKVGVKNMIQAGHGARYELECIACGYWWYAPRDAVSMLTMEAPSSNKNVGTVSSATAKFEVVEKKLASPRESDKAAASEALRKTTEAYMPVLDTQKSFGKSRKEENFESTKEAE